MMTSTKRKHNLKVLVCGGRNFDDRTKLDYVLNDIHDNGDQSIAEIIHGAAPGADTLAGQWAESRKLKVTSFPADWVRHGRGAGSIRNALMLKESRPDLVIAFPTGESKGTWDMIRKAHQEGIEVIIYETRKKKR